MTIYGMFAIRMATKEKQDDKNRLSLPMSHFQQANVEYDLFYECEKCLSRTNLQTQFMENGKIKEKEEE